MYTLRQAWQTYRTRNGVRLLIVLIIGIASVQFYTNVKPSSLFIGMYRISDDPSTPNLLVNVYAIAFIACGLALPLEQPSEYLCVPDYLVYIRQRRGIAHFLRYLLTVVMYSSLFTGMQTVIAWQIIPHLDIRVLLSSSVCAACMLLVFLLFLNLTYSLGNRSWGYFLVTMLYALLLSIQTLAYWFAHGTILFIPVWVPVLICMLVVLCIGNLHVFRHLEIQ